MLESNPAQTNTFRQQLAENVVARRSYGRKPSPEFGAYLQKWRKDANLNQDEAARRLGIESKNPGAYLSQIEHGDKPLPDAALLKIPQAYDVPPEEVLRRAYWPQLTLFLLTAIMEPTELPKAIEEYLEELENALDEEELRELTRYAAFLFLSRHVANRR